MRRSQLQLRRRGQEWRPPRARGSDSPPGGEPGSLPCPGRQRAQCLRGKLGPDHRRREVGRPARRGFRARAACSGLRRRQQESGRCPGRWSMREFQPSLESRHRGERPRMIRLLAAVALAAALPLAAYANGVVQSMRGDVKAGPVGQTARTVAVDQRLTPGTAVVTGADAQAVLRFDDGQQVVLNQNTEFRIVDFRYESSDSNVDRTVFDLIKGALRMASGAIVGRNRQVVAMLTPQATIGIRGTDFMVALVNPAYISVLQGAVTATNAAGTVAFGAGTFGSVANSAALAAAIPPSALPAAASAAFSSMSAAAGVAAAGGASAGAAGTGAAGGAGGVGAAGVAAGAAAAAGVAASTRKSSTTSHH